MVREQCPDNRRQCVSRFGSYQGDFDSSAITEFAVNLYLLDLMKVLYAHGFLDCTNKVDYNKYPYYCFTRSRTGNRFFPSNEQSTRK